MNVPFISSGALGRVHYALVRKVEEATSEGLVNRILESEIKSTRVQLTQPGLSLVRVVLSIFVLLLILSTETDQRGAYRTFILLYDGDSPNLFERSL